MSDVMRIAIWVALAVAVIFSALLVIDATNEVRVLHRELQAAVEARDEQMKEQSRLLLERSAEAALPVVEQIAIDQLGMQFPGQIVRVTP